MEKQRDKAAKRLENKKDGPSEPEIMSLEEANALRSLTLYEQQ